MGRGAPCCFRWITVLVLVFLCSSSVVFSDAALDQRYGSERVPVQRSIGEGSDAGSLLWELPVVGNECDARSPVCGKDGIRFESECHAVAAGVPVLETGGCEEVVKVEKRKACNIHCFRADPVCGEDDVTYWCGATEANCAGVEVAHTGFCHLRNDGTGAKRSRAAQSLFLLHLVWMAVAGIIVIAGLM